MTYYVSDLISMALRSIGAKALNDELKPNASIEALKMLNIIRAHRSIRPSRNWHIFDQTYTATASTHYITLGTPASNITTNPTDIDEVVIMMGPDGNGNFVNNWSISLMPYTDYRKLMVQTIFAIPNAAYIDTEYPQRKIWFYPGLAAGYAVRVVGKSYFTDYENISDEWLDPPETFDILRLELATKMAPLYGIGDDVTMPLVKQLGSENKAYAAYLMNRQVGPQFNQAAVRNGGHGSSAAFYGGIHR